MHLPAEACLGTAKRICKGLRPTPTRLGILLLEQTAHCRVWITGCTNQSVDLAGHLRPGTAHLFEHLIDLRLWYTAGPSFTDPETFELRAGDLATTRWQKPPFLEKRG